MKVAERSDSRCFLAELIVDSIINIIIITPLLTPCLTPGKPGLALFR